MPNNAPIKLRNAPNKVTDSFKENTLKSETSAKATTAEKYNNSKRIPA